MPSTAAPADLFTQLCQQLSFCALHYDGKTYTATLHRRDGSRRAVKARTPEEFLALLATDEQAKKVCSRCLLSKQTEGFSLDVKNTDGRNRFCKACEAKQVADSERRQRKPKE